VRRFSQLYRDLDATPSTREKVRAMVDYFAATPPADAAWAVHLLTGRRPKRLLGARQLRQWTARELAMPEWLVAETHAAVGDLAETIALLVGGDRARSSALLEVPLHQWMTRCIGGLRELDDGARRRRVTGWWSRLPPDARLVVNKLIMGGFRVGVSHRLVVRALAHYSGVEADRIAHRLMGDWQPSAGFFERLIATEELAGDADRPYPFFLASPLAAEAEDLGAAGSWWIEWKWDGIRAQLLVRDGGIHIWSRGEEPLTGRFPEIEAAAGGLPGGTVLDGEILAWGAQAPLPFASLQRRIGRRRPDRRVLREAPVRLLAYDVLESAGVDRRGEPLERRRERLEAIVDELAADAIGTSARLVAGDWATVAGLRRQARARRTEGVMLKRLGSPYRVGRVRGDWWKWKIAPRTIDAVLLYAQPGRGRRSGLFTDYTFGVWQAGSLVPVAKAYSGLDQGEIEELDRWIRRHTRERFGPVRAVGPAQVFELACDGVQRSARHKAGLTLRFPRIQRWRRDLGPEAADRVADVRELLDD